MQKITTFLTFNDRAEEAVKFYTSVFKTSKILTTTRYLEDGPMPKGTFMTAEFELEGQRFVVLNGGSSFTFSQGISLMVSCETQQEIDYYWEKLTAGGGKEIQCGWLVDKFGVSWQVTPSFLPRLFADKDEKKAQRAMNAMMQMKKLDIAKLKQAFEGT
jgi:predicted 3-demethylubiquinone-9 3-methyltransferase (glyoxalase superfamily)